MCIFHLYSDTESEDTSFQNVSLIEYRDKKATDNDQEFESSDYVSTLLDPNERLYGMGYQKYEWHRNSWFIALRDKYLH